MTAAVVVVFVAVYVGMVLGGLPRLKVDRTGIALLGAIAMLAVGALDLDDAVRAIDVPTIVLLFALMVVSVQLRLGGFYAWVASRLAAAPVRPAALLALLVAVCGALSAVFSNDIICLAMTPVLLTACRRGRLDPVPFLLALACAANAGSAATLIGNPQNMLIGQVLRLSFSGYLAVACVPALLGLAAVWAVVAWQWRGRWLADEQAPDDLDVEAPPFDAWQVGKGLAVALLLLVAFLFAPWPRDVVALAGAGVLLTSRRLHSRDMLGLVDWQLLVLFAGLFVVNRAFEATGLMERALASLAAGGVDARHPLGLLAVSVPLSNLVSNVPAVMLLLPAATHPLAGPALALGSTLAGNLLIVGSIANIIVVESAKRHELSIDWRRHARTGVPVTLATLAIATGWLWLVSAT